MGCTGGCFKGYYYDDDYLASPDKCLACASKDRCTKCPRGRWGSGCGNLCPNNCSTCTMDGQCIDGEFNSLTANKLNISVLLFAHIYIQVAQKATIAHLSPMCQHPLISNKPASKVIKNLNSFQIREQLFFQGLVPPMSAV